jgi:two-component system, NarL family, sensor histidine kinase UhpB
MHVAKLDDLRLSSERTVGRLSFDTVLSNFSADVIDLPPEEMDQAIEDVLRDVCGILGVESAVLWQESDAPHALSISHSVLQGGDPQRFEPMLQEHFPYVSEQILAGRMVRFATLRELPFEAAVDRENAERFGIKSSLCLPISVGGESPRACLAFNAVGVERDWPDELVSQLKMVAQVFAHALARNRVVEAYRTSETCVDAAAELADLAFLEVDFAAGTMIADDRLIDLLGVPPDRREGLQPIQFWAERLHPDDAPLALDVRQQVMVGERGQFLMEYRYLHPSRGERWVQHAARATKRDGAGRALRTVSVLRDITKPKRDERDLLRSETRLNAGAELAGLAFYEIDYGAGTMFVDDRLRALLGVPPELEGPAIEDFWFEHVHADDVPRMVELIEKGKSGEIEEYRASYRYLSPGQAPKWIQHIARAITRDDDGRLLRTHGVLRDVTERYRAESDLREVSLHMIRAHEEERAALGRELHDDVSQRLAALAINLRRAELASPPGEQAEAMRDAREGLVRLSDDIHSLAYQLHPAILEELGLAEALRMEGERHSRQGLHVRVKLDSSLAAVDDDLALCLFRVTQEALNNVTRHAEATVATVRLTQADDGFLLTVSDNGAGFDSTDPKTIRSLGLVSMRERTRLVNGTLEIESSPGHGTKVVAWMPTEAAS